MPKLIKNSLLLLSPPLKGRGAALTEYLPIIFMVSLMAIVGFVSFGDQIRQKTAALSDVLTGSDLQRTESQSEASSTPAREPESGGSSPENSTENDGVISNSVEFVAGAVSGLSSQVEDALALVTNPVETVENLITLGQALIEDPVATLQVIADALGEDVNALLNGDSREKGYVIGSYVSPAALVKIASRLNRIAANNRRRPGNEGCSSFAADTLVWTKRGLRPISELDVGDQVLARNDEHYGDSYQTVEKLHHREAENYYQIRVQQHFIDVTEEHPFWKQSVGWVTARSLTTGDVIATAEGDLVVREVKRVNQPLKVHNLTIANDHNYFVSQYGLWVHNMSGKTPCEVTAEIKSREEFDARFDPSSFPSQAHADAAWDAYKNTSTDPRPIVMGRLPDTEAGEAVGFQRLNTQNWSLEVNDAWVQGGIDAQRSFYLGSNPNIANYRAAAEFDSNGKYLGRGDHPDTVFFREMRQLRDAGYRLDGDYMRPQFRGIE